MAELSLAGIKAAIFDMDGTMIDNSFYHQKAWLTFCERYKITLTPKEYKRKVSGKRNEEILEMLFQKKLAQRECDILGEEKEQIYRVLYGEHVKETKGLTRFIEKLLSKKFRIAIATTSPKKNREFILKKLNLEDKFELVMGGEHVRNGKPDPEIYLLTAKKLKVKPSECLVFEDSPAGVSAAKSAGMKVIAIETSHKKEELQEADYFINSFNEVALG